MLTFLDIQNEVKRRAVRDQSGPQFDEATKNVINSSLFRLSRDANWRVLRRKSTITTKIAYSTGTGTGSFTNNSTTIVCPSATFLTDGIETKRYIKLSGDGQYHVVNSINSETSITLESVYSGTSTTTGTYSVLGQGEYILPIQCSHRMFMWHRFYGYPLIMGFLTDQEFYGSSAQDVMEAVPTHYRMWSENMVRMQPRASSQLSISSSSASDLNIPITIFGTVSGYPDSETINTSSTDGTTVVTTTKSFSEVERISKGLSSVGRITVTADSGLTTVTVLPVGDTTAGIMYSKLQLWPLPRNVFDLNIEYYKDPYRLVNDNDIHELGQEFDEALILLSVSKIKFENSQEEGKSYFDLYQDEIRSLRRNNVDKIDWFPTLKRPYWGNSRRVGSTILNYDQAGPYYGRSSRF